MAACTEPCSSTNSTRTGTGRPIWAVPIFTHGAFGEDSTVDGLADNEVRVGDRYRIGGALFEVSQPRVTCYRVGIRLDESRMPALLVAHRRPGFYMRVLSEGPVQAGDAIVKVASGPEGVTIADVDALLYLHDHPRDELLRALGVDALSPGWKASLAALLEQVDSGRPGHRESRSHHCCRAAAGVGQLPPATASRASIVRRRPSRPCGSARPTAAPCRLRCRGSTSPSSWCSTRGRRSFATIRCRDRRAARPTASA